MKLIPKSKSMSRLLGLALVVSAPAAFAAESNSGAKVIETEDGKTVELRRQVQTNDEGDKRARRGFKVTDADGEVVARGQDRGRKNADGSKAGAQRREFTDENGNTYQKRRRAQADGNGNARVQRHRRTLDENGNVTRRDRSKGKKAADGRRVKKHQRQFTDSKGRKTNVVKRKRVTANGSRQVTRSVKKKKR